MSLNLPIFLIEKDGSRHSNSKISLLKENIKILSSLNQTSNPHPNSSSSFFQTTTGQNLTNLSFFHSKSTSLVFEVNSGYTNSSFIQYQSFFPKNNEEEGIFFTKNSFNINNEKESASYYNNTLQSFYFNQNFMINPMPNLNNEEDIYRNKDIIEENTNNKTNDNKKKNKTSKKKKKNFQTKKVTTTYKCEHINCPLYFSTAKQKYSHHKKMCKECKKDTISLLKGISRVKNLYYNMKNKDNISKELRDRYHSIMTSKSLEGYAQLFAGLNIEDIVIMNDTKEVEKNDIN